MRVIGTFCGGAKECAGFIRARHRSSNAAIERVGGIVVSGEGKVIGREDVSSTRAAEEEAGAACRCKAKVRMGEE